MNKGNSMMKVETDVEARLEINGMSIAQDQTDNQPVVEDIEKTGCLMDDLHLHLLQLIEDRTSQQLALATYTARAKLDLSRARLQQGSHHIASAARLPGSSRPFHALCRIQEQDLPWGSYLKLLDMDIEPAMGYLQPVTQMFGALVPSTLRQASHKWMRCVDQIVECANIQRELESVIKSIAQLKSALHRRDSV